MTEATTMRKAYHFWEYNGLWAALMTKGIPGTTELTSARPSDGLLPGNFPV